MTALAFDVCAALSIAALIICPLALSGEWIERKYPS